MPPASGPKKGQELKKAKPKAFKLQLHIIEVKDIKVPKGVVPDLVVTASVGHFGTLYTQVQRGATSAVFDTPMEWKFSLAFEDFQAASLKLQVLNAKTDAKSEALGMYNIKLTQIRKQPLGEYFMVWLALYQDPDEYVTELSGSLLCTISCLGGSQAAASHTEEEVLEAQEDDSPMVLMPDLVRWTHYSLFVAIYRVEGLPNMDDYGSTDAFVSVKLPGQAASKTRVVRNNLNPYFNELLRLPVQATSSILNSKTRPSLKPDFGPGPIPSPDQSPNPTPKWQTPMMNDTITIAVSDFDQGGYDDLVADTTFSLHKIISRGRTEPHWIPMYGIKGREGLQDLRERLPHVPLNTCYKGRLLVGLIAEEVSTKLAPNSKVIGPCADPPSEPFIIRFDLYQASQLDKRSAMDNSQIQVELQVGGITLESDTALVENGSVRWDQMFEEKQVNLPSDLEQCPDIFINVNYTTTTSDTAERLGYIRLDLEDVVGFNHPSEWRTLLRDPLYPKVAAVPGFLQYRLDFGKLEKMPHSERERIVQPPLRKYELRGHIYQARNLPSMDDDGLCNPYTVVSLQGYAGKTSVADPTCNPIWNETVQLEVQLPQPIPHLAQILIRVYDQESGEAIGGDQLIGNCYVPLLGGGVDKKMPAHPEWMPICFDDPSNTRGELLCSFQLVAAEELAKVPLNDITPRMHEVEVVVNVVGLRDLLPYSNAPISQPSIEIDCGDRSSADKYPSTKRSHKPSGSDANFLETLVIRTRLPEQQLYCPQLNVRVFDYRGEDNIPVIAKCSIPLAPCCEWMKDEPYVPNNRPQVPSQSIVEAIDEASDEEDDQFDQKYEKYRSTIEHDLFRSNFGFMPEMRIDTPSLAEKRDARKFSSSGKLRTKGIRTLPLTSTIRPPSLKECEADEDSRIEQPLEHELEHEIQDPPFDEWTLFRGTGFGGSTKREVGKFKARVKVVEAELKSKADPSLDWDIFEQSVYITRLYVTKAIKLTSRDADGLADPFLIIKNGKSPQNIKDDVENFKKDTLNPNFYKCYELPTLVPGNPTLTIEVWDKDLHGRQLIGSTTIDIENRIFSQEWLDMNPKPVERRYLWSPASLAPQGKLECWLEMLTPAQALAVRAKPLKAPTQIQCQLRVVVYQIKQLEFLGKSSFIEAEGTANVFVTAQAGPGLTYESDVHNGVESEGKNGRGTADFNWRFVFDFEQPARNTKLSVQIWDARSTSANDSLAECVLQLSTLYLNVRKAHRVHEVERQFYKCTHPLYPGEQGYIEMGITMMTSVGRENPNNAPFLPPPNRSSLKRNISARRANMSKALSVVPKSLRIAGRSSSGGAAGTKPSGWTAKARDESAAENGGNGKGDAGDGGGESAGTRAVTGYSPAAAPGR